MAYNSGVIVLVTSNRTRAACSANLKLLARLLPELYSTQSYYHYLLVKVKNDHRSLFSNLSKWKEEALKESGLQRDSNP